MKKISYFRGVAVSLDSPNIDTDQIIPARFLLRTRNAGYGDLLFRDSRFTRAGVKRPEHVLNLPQGREASILVGNQNFGCGSAREQAAYALYDFGIRAIIAPSFGEIFKLNCVRNGIVPAIVSDAMASKLHAWLSGGANRMGVDLSKRLLTAADFQMSFEIEDVNVERLMEGHDEIDETLKFKNEIAAFEKSSL